MTLKRQFQQAISAFPAFASGDQLVEIEHANQRLSCQLTELDSLACALTRLTLRSDSLSNQSIDALKKIAERLSARLTYLLEPISPIEVDSQGCVVQLRSNPPQKDSDSTSYYELLVARSGELSLSRYARRGGEPRQSIAAHLTREVLARLVDDFSSAAS